MRIVGQKALRSARKAERGWRGLRKAEKIAARAVVVRY